MSQNTVITRFAPSPTGELHLGHIYSALRARGLADDHGGEMRLRIDDIDHTRCRPNFTQGIYDDLEFMGISYDGPVLVQSARMEIYNQALLELKKQEFIYPCFLTRREFDELLSAPHNTDQMLSEDEINHRTTRGEMPAWRLRMEEIRPRAQGLTLIKTGHDPEKVCLDAIGDVVIARKDIGTSYHLSVVLDDDASGVTHVTRGDDLKSSTPLHRLIYHLLDLSPPVWAHHPLITDSDGKRLAKRDHARSIASLRQSGMSSPDIMALISNESATS
jgi:glutamyl-Q tRNA(Asp) synthetase